MPADRVVEFLDVVEHGGPGGVPRLVDLSADPFGFQRREEAFHGSVIPYVSGTAHRTVDAIVGDQPLELVWPRQSRRSVLNGKRSSKLRWTGNAESPFSVRSRRARSRRARSAGTLINAERLPPRCETARERSFERPDAEACCRPLKKFDASNSQSAKPNPLSPGRVLKTRLPI